MNRRNFLGKISAFVGLAALMPSVKAEAAAFDGYAEGAPVYVRQGYAQPVGDSESGMMRRNVSDSVSLGHVGLSR